MGKKITVVAAPQPQICEYCGAEVEIHRHHKSIDFSGESDSETTILCRDCHVAVHMETRDTPRVKRASVRLTLEELRCLRRAAYINHRSLADWMRVSCLEIATALRPASADHGTPDPVESGASVVSRGRSPAESEASSAIRR